VHACKLFSGNLMLE